MSKQLFKITIILFLGLFSCKNENPDGNEIPQQKQEQSSEAEQNAVYYLIRHAEKDRTDPSDNDPMLTERGLRRAALWSRYFDTIALHAVYSTKYNRTMQTAKPTALKQAVDIQNYDPSDLYNSEFKNATQGMKVLVVGHSNTTPAFVNKILGQDRYENMDDSDNSSIYIVRVAGGTTRVSIGSVELR